MATQEEKHTKKADALLKSLMSPGTRLDSALCEYHTKHKRGIERVGLCHNIAIAIILDLSDQNLSAGWRWCCGLVDGGVKHSWVEFYTVGVDMHDDGKMRIWSQLKPPFLIDGTVERRNNTDTINWVKAWEEQQAHAASVGPHQVDGVAVVATGGSPSGEPTIEAS